MLSQLIIDDEYEAVDGEVQIGNTDPIPISCCSFTSHLKRFVELLSSGRGIRDLVSSSGASQDAIIQLVIGCQNREMHLTVDNVFEIQLVCGEWKVNRSLRQVISKFIEEYYNDPNFVLASIDFRRERNLPIESEESYIRRHIIDFIDDSRFLTLPLSILARVVDFQEYEDDPIPLRTFFRWCLTYLSTHGPARSVLFTTLNLNWLSAEDVELLCSQKTFLWCFAYDSIHHTIDEAQRRPIS
jgi:hypothetical protein